MKVAVLIALVSVAFAAPQPRKVFHEHYDDFTNVIGEEVGDEIYNLFLQYFENEEFVATINFLQTADFKNLVFEMEDLPEFKAVQDYLESHGVDINYFIDNFNSLLESADFDRRSARQSASGTDFNSFVKDITALFPQETLAALFDEKVAEDEDFKAAIEGLQSEEFQELWDALFDSPVFQAEVQTLADNGMDIIVLFDELLAVFGQKYEGK